MPTQPLKQNGITLIALIITIIVMLILVGVTVNVALNGGLFETANESTRQMEEKTIYEQIVGAMKLTNTGKTDVRGTYNAAKANLESQGKTVTPTSPAESEITDATASITFEVKGKKGTYTYTITTEKIIIGTIVGNRLIDLYGSTLNVGDYVEYKPDEVSAYSPDGTVAGSLTGYTDSLQSVAQDTTLKWRVLGSDGTHVLLISATPTTSNSTSMNFYGYVGYNNYEDVLEDTCEALYSNTTIGATARSITMDDIDKYLGGSVYPKSSFGAGNSSEYYGFTNTISSKFKPQANGTLSKLDTAENIELTQDAYGYFASDVIEDSTQLELLTGSGSTQFYYWVSGRAMIVHENYAEWVWSWVYDGEVLVGIYDPCDGFANTYGEENGVALCLRPVVVLDTEVTDTQVTITGSSTPNARNGLNAGS